jgi:hypothetical protein
MGVAFLRGNTSNSLPLDSMYGSMPLASSASSVHFGWAGYQSVISLDPVKISDFRK